MFIGGVDGVFTVLFVLTVISRTAPTATASAWSLAFQYIKDATSGIYLYSSDNLLLSKFMIFKFTIGEAIHHDRLYRMYTTHNASAANLRRDHMIYRWTECTKKFYSP